MLQAPCLQISVDSGTQRTLLDVAGQPLYAWDADDRAFQILYDELRRLLEKKVTESSATKTLEVFVYGEGQTNDKQHNLRDKPYMLYDGAGLIKTPDYDFKGNPLTQERAYTEDATQHPDWTTIGNVNLETETYETATAYDALNRPTQMTTPDNGITDYTYDKSGLLKTVSVDNVHSLDTDIVNNIEYDAKGQRQKIQYKNGATTTYEYDAFTFRVRNIKTTRASDGKILQDLQYWYDPVGNITLQKDGAQQPVYFNGTVADPKNDYTYDALYRLIQAEGRELAGNNNAPTYNDSSRMGITPIPIAATDTAKMRRYVQYYEYDAVGNFIQMRHTVTGGTGNWTRNYTTDNNSNRLMSTVVGSGTPESYAYDNRGNIINGFSHLQSMSYNADNRLEKVVINSTRTAYYQYDANGQRVRKTIVDTNSNTTEIRKYVGEWEVYRKLAGSSLNIERETLHISDDTGRIALIDTRTQGSEAEPSQLLRYQYSNHLQSASLELDDLAAIISYEEYYPYGSTSFQSGRNSAEVSLKRYRYCAAERDEENGFYYFGARYYIPWLARWTAVDPINSENYNLQKGYGLQRNRNRDFLELTASAYEYAYDNPVNYNDIFGEQPPHKNKINLEYQKPPVVDNAQDVRSKPVIIPQNIEVRSDSPAPNPISYGIDYYKDRAQDFKNRNPGKAIPTYYLGYGNKYIHRFTEETKATLSPEGQKWLDDALHNLQVAMELKLTKTVEGKTIELNNKRFTDFAFDSHVEAYEKAGVLKLPIMDKMKILLTPDAKDLFSNRGLEQATLIAKHQIEYYIKHPAFAIQQAKEVKENFGMIITMVHDYYLKNKKFFDNAAASNPQQWSDPEYKILGIIKNLMFPTFSF